MTYKNNSANCYVVIQLLNNFSLHDMEQLAMMLYYRPDTITNNSAMSYVVMSRYIRQARFNDSSAVSFY